MNTILTKLTLLVLCAHLIVDLSARPPAYQFSGINIFHGLSHNQVNAIYKDSRGFMWFGTRSGLNRYDGYDFKVFLHDSRDAGSVVDDYISGISEAPGGKLFIRTRKGNSIYNQRTEKFISPEQFLKEEGLPQTGLRNIVKTENTFIFLYDKYIYQYVENRRTLLIKTLTSDVIADIKMDGRGDLVIVYTNGKVEVMDGRDHHIKLTNTRIASLFPNQTNNFSLFIDNNNDCWLYVATNPLVPNNPLGIIKIKNDGKVIRLTRENGVLSNNLINGITQDDKGMIWVGTDHGGINILHPETLSGNVVTNDPEEKGSLAQNSIYCLYKDDRGIIWAGTYKKGISYYHERLKKFPLYTQKSSDPNTLPFPDVNRFVEDKKGNLWIGTNGGGLIYFDRKHNTYKQYLHSADNNNSIGNDVIVSLFIDHEDKLWIGSYFGGLDCFDGKTFTHYRNNADSTSLSDDRVWEIFEDAERNLWVGTLTGGLNKFDRNTKKFARYTISSSPALSENYISALAQDKQGRLWVGTSDGLDVLNYRTGQIVHYNSTNSALTDNYIITLRNDRKGNIWIGTRNGLNRFETTTGTILSFNTDDGLPDKNILNIEEDNSGQLWISTPNGISRVSVVETGERVTISCQNYDELDGLQDRSFNENASLKTRSGEIIFGGANGFNIFQPSAISGNVTIPPLVLTHLQISNTAISPGKTFNGNAILHCSLGETEELNLKHNENDISLEFSALSYTNTEKNRYAYRLEGFNDSWIHVNAQNRRAVYTNLDPGEYVFRVKGSNEDGLWNENGAVLRINIMPPFWKSDIAYILYILLGAALLIAARQVVINRARLRFAIEQERREAQRLHELDNMKIRFFTNVSHEFRTPLSLILSPVSKLLLQGKDPQMQKQLQMVHRNARRLLNMVNQLLDFKKLEEQQLNLNPEPGDILKSIRDIAYSFTDLADKKHIAFSYASRSTTLRASFDGDKLERILFNILSNAFKFTPENGEVSVTVDVEERTTANVVAITIADNGVGIAKENHERIFERFYQDRMPPSVLNQGSGIGLSITREFVRMMQGSINVESEPGKGSRFTVLLPFDKLAETVSASSPVTPAVSHELAAVPEQTILLVEDNDDFRVYLKESLQDHFRILEASNGKSGWQKLLSSHPDLVVSDIAMPEMDGIELSKKIKADERTKQVPVVLLTALTGEEQQLTGLRTGVTDYLTKPFSVEILISRIRNILDQQKTLKETYSKLVDVKTTDVSSESPNEKFIQKVLEIVEKNISNADFSVEDLSQELFMSRAATYKKIFAATGKPPLEFIRSVRLQRAAQLLTKTTMTVSEIAYEVGFNNPKYFTKHFKAEFNKVPSEYASNA